MALVFAAFTPHTPLIIPHIGKEHRALLPKTENAFVQLANELYASRPETIIIISAHGQLLPDAFTINQSPSFSVAFHDFGDVVTKLSYKGDIGFAHHLREQLQINEKIILTTDVDLDHGVGVPLYMLMPPFGKSQPHIIPIMYSMLDFERHYSFGMKLQQEICNTTKRIAVIASGELSHRLTKKSPAGYSAKGIEFDQQIQTLLAANKPQKIVSLPPALVEQAGECGFRSLLILLGILNSVNYRPNIMSYEAPFGIGYLAAHFPLA